MDTTMHTDDTPILSHRCTACRAPYRRHPERGLCEDCFAEMNDWTLRLGSHALQRRVLQAELLPVTLFAIYLGERLGMEHGPLPGWNFDPSATDPRMATAPADYEALALAQHELPDAEVRFLRAPHKHRRGCKNCPRHDWNGPVLVATFHGAQIMKRLGDGR